VSHVSTIVSRLHVRTAGLVAGAVMAFAGLTGIGATTASAQTVPPPNANLTIVSATDTQPVGDANTCGNSNFRVRLAGTFFNVYVCAEGTFDVTGLGPFQHMRDTVTRRVWLHQTFPDQGWGDCFQTGNPPVTFDLDGRDSNPGDVQLTSNHNAC
jgi:hypothetical protein